MRIFLLEPYDGVNYSSLENTGEIAYLYNRNEERPALLDPMFVTDIAHRLERNRYDPDTDFVAVVGKMVPVNILTNTISYIYEAPRFLVYDARTRKYQPITISYEDNSPDSV